MAASGEIGNGRIAGGDPSADEGSIPSSSTNKGSASATVRCADSVWADHAELVACRVLQDACRPLAGLRDRKRSRARRDHLGDHRGGVFDEQIEVRSDLRGLRFGNPLEGQVRWPVGAAGPVDRDVRPTSTVWTSHVAEELLPEGG